ncbi:hypothetical protein CONPUDRAFT_69694 [Coniophora puteana RWD-64-598 SS2]|uniref:Uncharacterized protein n=1 Tax=Coniophora puteana (strain RWD-64-598) TaxID=741705 RepID=A0A5M3MZT1_CONPW|nr:uncharacterized protein CONPUDRAFT_69694 [Coniophora puteana RWD-64-598 SS2]EIW84652.1 hypothetical protein CONPUDRAFT_69694 [Coniophora puteana RWD-64-598 SS2]
MHQIAVNFPYSSRCSKVHCQYAARRLNRSGSSVEPQSLDIESFRGFESYERASFNNLCCNQPEAANPPSSYPSHAKTSYDIDMAALGCFSSDLKETNETHSRLNPAVMHLPVEILAYIFVLSSSLPVRPLPRGIAPYFHREEGLYTNERGYSALVQVCRRWRDVALHTPRLWNMIKITLDAQETPSGSMSITAIPTPLTPLKRAGNQPTFIFLDLSWLSLHAEMEDGHLPVNPACGAVRGVQALAAYFTHLPTLLQWISQFENLTHLFLEHVTVGNPEYWNDAGIASQFHRLTHLHMRIGSPRDVVHVMGLHAWHNLLSLTIEPCVGRDRNFQYLANIFAHVPNLIQLWIVGEDVNDVWETARIASDKLQLFALIATSHLLTTEPRSKLIRLILDDCTFPALANLVVTRPPDGDIDFIRRFLIRSRCRLSSLTFTEASDNSTSNVDSSSNRRGPLTAKALLRERRPWRINVYLIVVTLEGVDSDEGEASSFKFQEEAIGDDRVVLAVRYSHEFQPEENAEGKIG